jgi:1-acyl-sn-glycerol-3-phosphate acyltransferase
MTPFRVAHRLARLAWVVGAAGVRIAAGADAARVVHHTSRRVLQILGVDLQRTGEPPRSGILVANHLGYLDVIAIAATTPAVFVAKSEVRDWPVVGFFAARMGCIFAERTRPTRCGHSVTRIEEALSRGRLVVVFPEATSTPGETVLPFRSSLLEPAAGRTVGIAALAYTVEPGEGTAADRVCFWGSMSLVPHLLGMLDLSRIHARLAFEAYMGDATDRKALARALHGRVATLHGRISRIGVLGAQAAEPLLVEARS